MTKAEYHEGPEALERFKSGMTKLFQAKKETLKNKPEPKRKQGKASKG
jgi:hypothetical protein